MLHYNLARQLLFVTLLLLSVFILSYSCVGWIISK